MPWRAVAGLGVAHLAWVNLHGSHLLGLALVGIHLVVHVRVPRARKAFGALLGIALLGSCISPYGPAIVTDAITHVFDPVYREIVREWSPWTANDPVHYLFALVVFAGLVVVVAFGLLRSGDRARSGLACAVLLAVMAFRSLRFVATCVLLGAPLLAEGLVELADRRRVPGARLGIALGSATLLALALASSETASLPPHIGLGVGERHEHLPWAAGHYLRRNVPNARILAPMEVSWYLMFADPSARFLIDGRVPFYGAEHVQRVGIALHDPALLESVIGAYDIDAVVLDFGSSAWISTTAYMRAMPQFFPVALENDFVTFVRATPSNGALIESTRYRTIAPELDPAPLLAPDAPLRDLGRELARLERSENAGAFAAWIRGMLALRVLARDAANAGFFAPRDAREREIAERASDDLSRAGRHYRLVPVVQAYRALAAVAACRSDEAKSALDDAMLEGGNREALLAGMELDLRMGDSTRVRALLEEAAGDEQAASDPWLRALGDDLARPEVRCP